MGIREVLTKNYCTKVIKKQENISGKPSNLNMNYVCTVRIVYVLPNFKSAVPWDLYSIKITELFSLNEEIINFENKITYLVITT